MKEFKDFLLRNRKERNIRIFFDVETLQYNEDEGRKKPTKYKNVVYSFAIGYYDKLDLKVKVKIFPNLKHFIDIVINTYSKWKNNPKFELIAQNTNKYDNHFLIHDLKYYYDLQVKNLYLKNATKEGNVLTIKKGAVTDVQKAQGIILEKRIKSSINLELLFFYKGIEFYTTDNLIKTNASIETLGEKLYNLDIITKDDLKTDYNYTKYNKDYDMSEHEARTYALKVFKMLTKEELQYIRNDIVILAESVINYSRLFKGFDYNKITFTSNILSYYNDNDLTSYQLLKSVGQGKNKRHLKYTNYKFNNENFYDFLKSFYAGGLNFYNDIYVGKLIIEKIIAMDINSSYPYAMHYYRVPTYLNEFDEFEKPTTINIDNININNEFFLYRMTKEHFDNEIIIKLRSKVLKQMLVKYYTSNNYVNINSYTLKMITNITDVEFDKLTVLSYVSFNCVPFASRGKIEEMYKIKEQGSSDKEIIFKNPYNIIKTEKDNNQLLTDEEIDISKVNLNGLYGIPALRSHFNIFRWVNDDLENVPNGYENNERNIVFSIFVTAVSLYNLLDPLKYLTQKEIDTEFIYCDTDSLYLKKNIQNKLPKELFHDHHLGKWSMEDENIEQFIVLNHKKYAYYSFKEKYNKKTITVKCAGIPNSSFDTNMSFKEFVKTQFNHGIEVKNTRGIYNDQGTISIYPTTTKMEVGKGYRIFANDIYQDKAVENMMNEIKNNRGGENGDILYIESNLGTFSLNDLYPHKFDNIKKNDLLYLKIYEDNIRKDYLQ